MTDFWRVKVDCWFRERPRSRMLKCVRRTILVKAADDSEAFKEALVRAKECAPMGVGRWVAFEVVEATTIKLPLVIFSHYGKTKPIKEVV